MVVLIIIMALALIVFGIYTRVTINNLRSLKRLNDELHDRYALLWADYTRRGQRITLYEAGMTKACVDELDRQVLARIEKYAKHEEISEE